MLRTLPLLATLLTLADASSSQALAAEHGKLDAGATHVCSVQAGGVVRCWPKVRTGSSEPGRPRRSATTSIPARAAVALGAGRTAVAVSAGGSHTCALLTTRPSAAEASAPRAGWGRVDRTIGDDEPSSDGGLVDLGPLARLPAQVRLDELFRSSPEDCVLVEDAVMNLVADGLADRHGDFVVPTRAAVRFREFGV
jgi:hypothetical protein